MPTATFSVFSLIWFFLLAFLLYLCCSILPCWVFGLSRLQLSWSWSPINFPCWVYFWLIRGCSSVPWVGSALAFAGSVALSVQLSCHLESCLCCWESWFETKAVFAVGFESGWFLSWQKASPWSWQGLAGVLRFGIWAVAQSPEVCLMMIFWSSKVNFLAFRFTYWAL